MAERPLRPGLLLPGLALSRREVDGLMARLLEFLGLPDGAATLTLADDRRMAELNLAYGGVPGPTNVLAFPAGEHGPAAGGQDEAPEALGEVVLCAPALEREAFLYGQDPGRHLVRLLAHACLHLVGHDHGPVMESLTEAAVDHLAD